MLAGIADAAFREFQVAVVIDNTLVEVQCAMQATALVEDKLLGAGIVAAINLDVGIVRRFRTGHVPGTGWYF